MIKFFSNTSFRLANKDRISLWLLDVIKNEEKILNEISYNFCSDSELLKVNKEFLNHDTLTDIITFDYSDLSGLSGEVLISTVRVKENAQEFSQVFDVELRRVMVHGVLHLCGFKDKTDAEKRLMTEKEDFYLSRFR
ncbi:MAG: rRNA maturation RNase YbeY [Flavobacteriales bacterium]|jgi:probable rRNA maturation factor|tara:strand:- start:74535 stop:74945 length:411 start_codon:yes stop_codon:yes gene_type:complete